MYAPLAEVEGPMGDPCAERGPACRDFERRGQTWRSQAGIFDQGARVVLLGDAGVRAGYDAEGRVKPGPGPEAVAKAAKAACGDDCDGVVFLGDNLYKSGVNDPADTAWLRAFAGEWVWAGPQYYVQGNHDWGTYPRVFRVLKGKEYRAPNRDRAQRLFRDLRALGREGLDLRGDSHFWAAGLGTARLVALDTNYLVRRCRATKKTDDLGIRCAGDGEGDDRQPIGAMVAALTAPVAGGSVVVGHHPWLSHGEHGAAGSYIDDDYRLWPGHALRAVFDAGVAPGRGLYVSGHDHNSQVARIDADTLAVVVGAGGKTTGPGEETGPGGERHHLQIEHEVFCHLGFAIVEVGAGGMTLEVHTLRHPDATGKDEDLVECRDDLEEDRPDLSEPPGPTCARWRQGPDGAWGPKEVCEGG